MLGFIKITGESETAELCFTESTYEKLSEILNQHLEGKLEISESFDCEFELEQYTVTQGEVRLACYHDVYSNRQIEISDSSIDATLTYTMTAISYKKDFANEIKKFQLNAKDEKVLLEITSIFDEY